MQTMHPTAPVRGRWRLALTAGLALWISGCGGLHLAVNRPYDAPRSGPLRLRGLAARLKDEKLRKEVEQDSFPNASEVGL